VKAPCCLTGVVSIAALASGHGLAETSTHHALRTAGPQAASIADLWYLMLAVCTLVLVIVTGVMLAAVARRRRGDATTPPDVDSFDRDETRARRIVTAAVGASVVLLVVLLVSSVLTDRAIARLPLQDGLHIEVTGKQWWWDVRYDDAEPSRVFTTANEIHVPVGRPVILTLKSPDVIHSFWVPSLHGKKDLIPGQTTTFTLRADVPGVYRGQCAEFCGYQHARMALLVIVDPPDVFEQWADAQRKPANPPPDARAQRGHDVFMATTCAMCHAIEGTPAGGRAGPNLTHVASRSTIAAVTLPNTAAHPAAWIEDPHAFKPGTNMPAHALNAWDRDALVAYLLTLK
jgi:cytochrome c oxidase subunit 2